MRCWRRLGLLASHRCWRRAWRASVSGRREDRDVVTSLIVGVGDVDGAEFGSLAEKACHGP